MLVQIVNLHLLSFHLGFKTVVNLLSAPHVIVLLEKRGCCGLTLRQSFGGLVEEEGSNINFLNVIIQQLHDFWVDHHDCVPLLEVDDVKIGVAVIS